MRSLDEINKKLEEQSTIHNITMLIDELIERLERSKKKSEQLYTKSKKIK